MEQGLVGYEVRFEYPLVQSGLYVGEVKLLYQVLLRSNESQMDLLVDSRSQLLRSRHVDIQISVRLETRFRIRPLVLLR